MLCQPVKLKRLMLLISWQSEDKGSEVYLKDEHRTSNVQHRMMNKKPMKLNCRAERHHYSMFNVGRSMFDVQSVRRSSFKTTPYGINVTCERLRKVTLNGER